MEWAIDQGIALHTVEFVAAFEKWNDTLGVWIFFETRKDTKVFKKNGTNTQLEEKFTELLGQHQYPFEQYPNVIYEFDSHENVVKRFEGNYFYRLK